MRTWYFNVAGGTSATLNLPRRILNSYTLCFCTWYVIANTTPGYMINNSYIQGIKYLYYPRVDFKRAHLKGMSEFLEAESDWWSGSSLCPGAWQRGDWGASCKMIMPNCSKACSRSSTEACSSHKKLRRGPETAAPLREILRSELEPELAHTVDTRKRQNSRIHLQPVWTTSNLLTSTKDKSKTSWWPETRQQYGHY